MPPRDSPQAMWLQGFLQSEADLEGRKMALTYASAKLLAGNHDPKSGASGEVTKLWNRYITALYGLEKEEQDEVRILEEEYDKIKDLRPTLKKGKGGGFTVTGLE